jgi:hypothetical protein
MLRCEIERRLTESRGSVNAREQGMGVFKRRRRYDARIRQSAGSQ